MSRAKTGPTKHGIQRALERTDLPKRQAEKLIKQACRYGKCSAMLTDGPIKEYVENKTQRTTKRVKYFCEYIFIFQKNSSSLITMYHIPESVVVAQKTYEAKEII